MSETATLAASLKIALDCVRTINFATQQNDVPIVRQLRITNGTPGLVESLHVRLTSEPELFPTWESVIARIPPNGTYALGPLDLRLSSSYLTGLTERVGGHVRAALARNGEVLTEHVEPIEMLAFDEWSGVSQSLPELLAAFVLPNHPEVESLLADAARWLRERTGDSSLSGYQSRSATRVAHIAQAIFLAIQGRGISYCNPPASFETIGQKIRLPDRIIEHKLATCLDLAVLAAACLEQAGLYPLVVMTRGHAFVGVWLIEECFADCLTDDLARLRKRIELNEMLVFETTLATSPPPNDFPAAVDAAKRHLADEADFHCAFDIQRCRKSRIRPLPIRVRRDALTVEPTPDGVKVQDAIFELNVRATIDRAEIAAPETPVTRLDKWKRKLLDLTLHNRLINFKQSKKTVELLCPDLTTLEDALADGLEFQVLPRPAEFEPGAQRSVELHRVRTGTDALNQLLRDEFKLRRLRANLTDEELRSRLTETFRASRTAMEEGGASALYLALGFLSWFETEHSEQRRLAPIILVPVELRRPSVQEGFRICQSDEDPRINITLLELLSNDFDLRIPGMEPIPEDEHGIDVRGILTTFRRAIKDTPRWDIIEEAQIGFFSFTKFLMWRDLEQRSEDLLRNKVVDHLVNRPNEPFPDNGGFPDVDRLDETYRPNETFCPLPADSSQLAAVYAAAAPKSFVLFGPPGTGKSQTITNLVAHCLADNKSVLFVSEKMAALNVVHKRLTDCGLAPFCLELHSNKTHKRHVIEQLGQALDYRAGKPPEDWERRAGRLASLRTELNNYVQALHRVRSFGESVFQATSRLAGLRDVSPVNLGLSNPDEITRPQLDRWRELIEQIRTAESAAGHPANSVWSACGIKTWSPVEQRAIETNVQHLGTVCERLEAVISSLEPAIGLGRKWSLSDLEFADKFLRLLASSPQPPAAVLTEPNWEATEASIKEWLTRGRRRDQLRQALYARYEEDILKLDLAELAGKLGTAQQSWFLRRWLLVRAVRRALASVSKQRARVDTAELARDLATAQELRAEEKRMADASERARALLGQYWKDGEADWSTIESLLDWSGRLHAFARLAAGGSREKAESLCRHWTWLVTDGHHSLQANGEIGQAITRFLEAFGEFTQLKTSLESRLSVDPKVWASEPKAATLTDIRTKVASWKANLPGLRAWCNWRQVRHTAIEAGLTALISAYETGEFAAGDLRSRFDRLIGV